MLQACFGSCSGCGDNGLSITGGQPSSSNAAKMASWPGEGTWNCLTMQFPHEEHGDHGPRRGTRGNAMNNDRATFPVDADGGLVGREQRRLGTLRGCQSDSGLGQHKTRPLGKSQIAARLESAGRVPHASFPAQYDVTFAFTSQRRSLVVRLSAVGLRIATANSQGLHCALGRRHRHVPVASSLSGGYGWRRLVADR